jgi:hypothetical protein
MRVLFIQRRDFPGKVLDRDSTTHLRGSAGRRSDTYRLTMYI